MVFTYHDFRNPLPQLFPFLSVSHSTYFHNHTKSTTFVQTKSPKHKMFPQIVSANHITFPPLYKPVPPQHPKSFPNHYQITLFAKTIPVFHNITTSQPHNATMSQYKYMKRPAHQRRPHLDPLYNPITTNCSFSNPTDHNLQLPDQWWHNFESGPFHQCCPHW